VVAGGGLAKGAAAKASRKSLNGLTKENKRKKPNRTNEEITKK